MGKTSFGNMGGNVGGVRVGGQTGYQSAFSVVGARKYRDFRDDRVMDNRQFQLAFRRLRQFSANLDIPVTEEGPSYGGAMLAMVGTGLFPDVRTCASALTRVKETILPDPALAEKYAQRYKEYKTLYPSLRDVFRRMRRQ